RRRRRRIRRAGSCHNGTGTPGVWARAEKSPRSGAHGTVTLSHVSRRLSTLLVALVPAVLLLVLATSATVPLVSMGPGPPEDSRGEAQAEGGGRPALVSLIGVHGREGGATPGTLTWPPVAVRDQLPVVEAVRFWLGRRLVVVPRDQVLPPGRSEDEV